MIWFPTLLGWACIVALVVATAFLWVLQGERFLSPTDRLRADVLVVEGWIGIQGVQAAAAEFTRGGYSYFVTTSGMTDTSWDETRYSYAEMAAKIALQSGIANDKIITAGSGNTEAKRTFESAVAVYRALKIRGIHPSAINVFTLGTHARRSQLVFAKVFRHTSSVGIVSWIPLTYNSSPWWRSSDRSGDMIKETAGYLFELFANSGRDFDATGSGTTRKQ